MSYDNREGILTIEGADGQRIGIRTDGPSVEVHIGNGAASFAGDSVGFGNNTPCCRLEVRSDGAVGVGLKNE